MPSIIQTDTLKDGSGTKTLAEYSSSAWGWGSGCPAGTVIQLLQSYKGDRDSVAGSAQSDGTNANNFAFIPGQGSDAVFQQAITTTGSNKVLITHHGNYGCSAKDFTLMIQLFRGSASDTAIGSCTKLGAGDDVGNSLQTQSNILIQTTNSGGMRSVSFSFLDSPGAGTHYYKLAWLGESGATHYINRTGGDGNLAYQASTASSLNVLEVQV